MLLLHGDEDIKIHASHSQRLFCEAVSAKNTYTTTASTTSTSTTSTSTHADRSSSDGKYTHSCCTSSSSNYANANQSELAPQASLLEGCVGEIEIANHVVGDVESPRSYFVQWNRIKLAGHNEVFSGRAWLNIVPSFAGKAESIVSSCV